MEVQKGVAAELRLPEADGDPVVLTEPKVTVVRDSDGATVVHEGTTGEDAGVFTFDLKGSEIPEVDLLTVTWSDENSAYVQQVEVVGGFACSLESIKKKLGEDSETLATKYPDSTVAQQRERATRDVEDACWDAFRHRYAKETLNGDNSDIIVLDHRRVAKILSLSINGVAYTDAEIKELSITSTGIQRNFPLWPEGFRPGWWGGFTEGTNNIVVCYAYGHESFPSAANPIRDLAADYLVDHPTDWESRATSYTDSEGNNYRMVTAGESTKPGAKRARFNVPSVNAFIGANEAFRLL
jgi:hypothetical protein